MQHFYIVLFACFFSGYCEMSNEFFYKNIKDIYINTSSSTLRPFNEYDDINDLFGKESAAIKNIDRIENTIFMCGYVGWTMNLSRKRMRMYIQTRSNSYFVDYREKNVIYTNNSNILHKIKNSEIEDIKKYVNNMSNLFPLLRNTFSFQYLDGGLDIIYVYDGHSLFRIYIYEMSFLDNLIKKKAIKNDNLDKLNNLYLFLKDRNVE